jgi:DNA invertase Pin-like site-specific DNA recombinase
LRKPVAKQIYLATGLCMLVGYARVSKSETQDTTAQVDALRVAGCERIFQEAASGGRWDRPELLRMVEHLRAGDVVVVWKLDRLSRSLKDLLNILDRVERAGATFRSLTEAVDTSGPSGRMMMQMLGSFAEFERAIVKERTNEGLKAARARGNAGGRKPKLSPTQQREITEMLAAGRSAADLARLFRVHRATISRMMSKAAVAEGNP